MGYVSSDIIGGFCIPWGSYKYVTALIVLVTYVMPLVTMLFCYSRVVYKLKSKVTSTLQLPFIILLSTIRIEPSADSAIQTVSRRRSSVSGRSSTVLEQAS